MEKLTILQTIGVWAIPAILAITLHEAAHGFVASILGDKTAKMLGRVSLNPIKHISPVGTLLVPALMIIAKLGFVFGWAKPVPVVKQNLNNPRRDMALVAIAGPLSNLIMALLWALALKILVMTLPPTDVSTTTIIAIYMTKAGIWLNVILFCLNIIPIPPLDGSRVLAALLPAKAAKQFEGWDRFGWYVVIALALLGVLSHALIPAAIKITSGIAKIFGLP